ncbi:MAG: CxxC-x17-CxxC domain-containing protein [Thermomicrobiales bacterium]
MSFEDKTLTCRDCGQEFIWTAGELEFFLQRGLVKKPGRCPDCLRGRKSQQGGGYASAGGYSAGGGYERPQRQMYPAVCSNCGKETMVPFQPRGDKPVYCSDCFAERRQTSSYGSGGYGRDRY